MRIEFLKGSKRARVTETQTIVGHIIKAGFIFNAANIPIWLAPLVWLTRWHPKIRRGACIHDWWWTYGDKAPLSECLDQYRIGNRYLRAAMQEDRCNRWQVFWVILAVGLSKYWRYIKKWWRVRK